MAKQDPSPLVEAAAAFDEELAGYARLGELFIKTPTSSVKHLERANGVLAELAACEERLQSSGQALVKTLAAARDQQELLAAQVVAHLPELQQRNQRLKDLMGELTAVAGEVGALNTIIQSSQDQDPLDVSSRVLELSTRAEKLAADAREAAYEELASQAHSLHQRLLAIGKKLQKASN